MVTGLGPLNLKDPKNIKLNSELGSSASARTSLTTTASKTRSSGTAARILVNSSQGVSSGSIFFTKAVRRPSVSSYQSAAGISRALNNGRQNYRYLSGIAATGVAAQSTTYVQSQSTASSVGETLGALAGLVTAGASAAKSLGLFQGKTNSQKIDNAMGNLSNTIPSGASSDVSGYINSMQNCNTAASLSASIDSAKAQLDNINSNYSSIESQLNDTINGYNVKEGDLKKEQGELKGNVDSLTSEKGTNESMVKNAKTLLNGAKQSEAEADNALKGKSAEYDKAVSDYAQKQKNTKVAEDGVSTAEKGVSGAKADLAKAKSQLKPDGTQDTDAIAKAELALAEAEKKLTEAKENLNKAKTEEQKAYETKKTKLDEKVKAGEIKEQEAQKVKDAQKDVKTYQTNLDNSEQRLETTKKNLEQAEFKLEAVQEKIDVGEKQRTMLEETKTNKETLSQAISQQEKRLAKMEKDETKAQTKAEKRAAKEGKTAQREENTESYLINKALNSSETSGSTNTGNWHTFKGNDGQQYVQIRSGSSTRYINKSTKKDVTRQEFEEKTSVAQNNITKNIDIRTDGTDIT